MPSASETSRHLLELAAKFETFRLNRPALRSHIPRKLWQEAVRLTSSFPLDQVAATLQVDKRSLEHHCNKKRPKPEPRSEDVLRVAPVIFKESPVAASAVLEIVRPDGLRILVHDAGVATKLISGLIAGVAP